MDMRELLEGAERSLPTDRYAVEAVADVTGAEEEGGPLVMDRCAVGAGVKAFNRGEGSQWIDGYAVRAAADEGVAGERDGTDRYTDSAGKRRNNGSAVEAGADEGADGERGEVSSIGRSVVGAGSNNIEKSNVESEESAEVDN